MIKRYMPTKFPHWDDPVMHPERDGSWVRYDDHAAEVERLKRTIDGLRAESDRLRNAQREAAIYGAAFVVGLEENSALLALAYAEETVDAWRAAQKGGER